MKRKSKIPKSQKDIIELPLQFIRKVAVHTFPLPNGKVGRWESLYSPNPDTIPTVLTLAITEERNIVIVKMFRFPVENFVVELPGGRPETNETLAAAARRELLEETGYGTAGSFEELTRCYIYNGKSNAIGAIFLAQHCRKLSTPKVDDVEQYVSIETAEETLDQILHAVAGGDIRYDPTISHAIIALLGKGILSL